MVIRIALPHASQRHVPIIEGERVSSNGETILERPDDKDRDDAERLTQSHLEQVSENQKFRVLARFFGSVRYLHIVPHVVREFRRDGDYRDDPFGSDSWNASRPRTSAAGSPG